MYQSKHTDSKFCPTRRGRVEERTPTRNGIGAATISIIETGKRGTNTPYNITTITRFGV
jgi:hypothetical protein